MLAAPVEPNKKRSCQLLLQLFTYQVILYHNNQTDQLKYFQLLNDQLHHNTKIHAVHLISTIISSPLSFKI